MNNVSVKKSLFRLTMPIFIDIALVMLLGAVDTVMLSRYSDNAVAAVGLDNQLISFVFLIYQFVSMGAAILCAQYYGAGYRTRFMQIVGIAVIVNTLLGMAVSFSLWMWAEPLLTAFVARRIAELRDLSTVEIARATRQNAINLFRLPPLSDYPEKE